MLRLSLKVLEVTTAAIGAGLVLSAAAAFADAYLMSRVALQEFRSTPVDATTVDGGAAPAPAVEDGAIAVLRIDRIGVEVPVFSDTDRVSLRRGVGTIEGTASPGTRGNIGIAGHRDGFFRPLKDIAVGDAIDLTTPASVQTFRVAEIRIVDPLDTSVLDPSDETMLTLVTCYPFYYVGFAPDRYIVHAVLENQHERDEVTGATL